MPDREKTNILFAPDRENTTMLFTPESEYTKKIDVFIDEDD